jgi:hypothetical protein
MKDYLTRGLEGFAEFLEEKAREEDENAKNSTNPSNKERYKAKATKFRYFSDLVRDKSFKTLFPLYMESKEK